MDNLRRTQIVPAPLNADRSRGDGACMHNSPRGYRQQRAAAVADFAVTQDDVVTLRQLYSIGLSRSEVRAELRARRWSRRGSQAVVVHNGPLLPRSRLWVAVLNAGADAALDGVSALQAAGLENFDSGVIHLSVSKGARYRRARGVRVHETRRRKSTDLASIGLPRVKPGIAAVRGALWARTDRQAALVLSMAVQQRITSIDDVITAMSTIRRHRRRKFLLRVIGDITRGAQSIGELDFLAECRRRGLPSPSHQVRRELPSGRVYLDVYWEEYGVVVEIEGSHHLVVGLAVADSLRQNELTIDHDRVLRIPVVGLRMAPDEFFEQIARLLRRQGWRDSTALRPAG